MHGPPIVGWLLVALGAATGAYCLLRMRAGCPGPRGDAGGEALMGLGMAAMAVPVAAVAGHPWTPPLFAAVFGAAALRELAVVRELVAKGPRARPRVHRLHHAVGAVAMVYMALAMGEGAAAHAAHDGDRAAGGVPLLTGALLAYYAVCVLWSGVRLAPTAEAGGGAPAGG
ncbi:DUF5134 domain-containing protein, partial [Streptomyces sp. URMC 123]|uniref:DUF5134 domain-containing protein n=1 Tax=Streptomyces sp. URMC 123 TaxID=3423403 RepID=UPI003F1DDAA9